MAEVAGETFEVDGHFWLPSDPDKRIAGILSFDRDTGGRLSLIGSFASEDDLFNETVRETRTIHGQSEKKSYTLDGCLTTHQSLQIFGGVGRQRFSVARIVEGALYGPDEPIEVDALIVDYTHLLEWSGLSGIEVSMTFNEKTGFDSLTILSKPLDAVTCAIPGGKLKLSHVINHRNEMIAGQSVRQSVQAKFEFDSAITLDEAIDSASDLQDLLTFANDKVVGFEQVQLQHPDLVIDHGDGKTRRASARLYAQWRAKAVESKKRTHTFHDMCFTYADLGGSSGLEDWMQTAFTYRSQLGRVANTRYNAQMFLQDVLLGRVAALESLHKELHRGERVTEFSGKKRDHYLTERLDDLIDLAGDAWAGLFGADSERERRILAWRDRAKDERNNIAHHLGRDLHSDVAEMYYVADAAYWLFVIAILRIANAPVAVFSRIVDQPRFTYSGRQLVSFL